MRLNFMPINVAETFNECRNIGLLRYMTLLVQPYAQLFVKLCTYIVTVLNDRARYKFQK